MLAQKRLLLSLAALAAAGLAGCLNSTEPSSSQFIPVTEAEIQAALRADSLAPARPPRQIVCDTLKARLEAMDTTAPQFPGFRNAVMHVCAVRPARPDSLRPDSLRPRPDSLRPQPPKPPRPDSSRPKPDTLRPQPPRPPKPDSLRPVPPAKPDSGMVPPRTPVKPVPPKKPVQDTASAE
jgi:hypothetical protein